MVAFPRPGWRARPFLGALSLVLFLALSGCAPDAVPSRSAEKPASAPAKPAPRAESTGGFDGLRARAHVEKLVSFGPRPPGSDGIRRAQDYIRGQLQGFGCAVDEDDFEASTPAGRVRMRNLVAKVPGKSPTVVLFLSHYDTKILPAVPGFIGANDGGSSTGVMLELARLLCVRKGRLTVWVAFLDGEESYGEWSDTDGTYGSRQLAARMALAEELGRVRAVLLADLVGYHDLRFRREANSTRWLTDLVWSTAARLGYQKNFLNQEIAIEDDHTPFLRRGVPAVDIIQLNDYPHWHSAQDTLDKISASSLGVVGHVLLETLSQLEKKKR